MSADTAPQLDVHAVRRWLDSIGVSAGDLTARLIAGGRSNPTYEITDGDGQWILRRPPYGHVLPTAHDMGREFRVLSALRDSPVPVPVALGLCRDEAVLGAPFYVMERLAGVTLRTAEDTGRLSPAQRSALAAALVDTLVALHEIDPAAVGLADWGAPRGFLDRQLSRWSRQWQASATRSVPQVAELLTRLATTRPDRGRDGIVHGDFKIDNVMVDRRDPTRIVGVLDWEMSTLGDTITDLGVLCSFWDHPDEPANPITRGATALPGFPRRDDLVARYAAARGIDVHELDWYIAFADLKVAVILEGVHARHVAGHTSGADFDGVGDMVVPLLDRALRRAATLRATA